MPFPFCSLARKKLLELNLWGLDLNNTMLLWNCQMHIVKQVIKHCREFYLGLSACDGKK